MKIVSVIAICFVLGGLAQAQQSKIVSEITSNSAVKNSPFSADAVSEHVQTLADGNRIVRSSTAKLYRNSEGRFRREVTGGTGGMLGSLYTTGQNVTLFDPVGGFRYMIDPNLRTTTQVMLTPRAPIKVVPPSGQEAEVIRQKLQDEIKAAKVAGSETVVLADKLKEEIRIVTAQAPTIAAQAVTGRVLTETLAGVSMGLSVGSHSKWETRTEELGTQNIEGVDAEGTRTITTIPAGAIGNERPIEITYEKWYSRELQLVVMSRHSDPRFGEQTYRLTNVIRAEPDPSLFTPPQGYRLITEPGSKSYTINARNAAIAEKAAAAKVKATTVSNTKP